MFSFVMRICISKIMFNVKFVGKNKDQLRYV